MSKITERVEWKQSEYSKREVCIMMIREGNPLQDTVTQCFLNRAKTIRRAMAKSNCCNEKETTQNRIMFWCISCEGDVLIPTFAPLTLLITILWNIACAGVIAKVTKGSASNTEKHLADKIRAVFARFRSYLETVMVV